MMDYYSKINKFTKKTKKIKWKLYCQKSQQIENRLN